jgi:hypothetical protein
MEDNMRNDTPSRVVVEFENLDHASKFSEFLQSWKEEASKGGDAGIAHWRGAGLPFKLSMIGHDVNVISVKHVVDVDIHVNGELKLKEINIDTVVNKGDSNEAN